MGSGFRIGEPCSSQIISSIFKWLIGAVRWTWQFQLVRQTLAEDAAKIGDAGFQTLFQLDLGRPAKRGTGQCDVGLTLARVVGGQFILLGPQRRSASMGTGALATWIAPRSRCRHRDAPIMLIQIDASRIRRL